MNRFARRLARPAGSRPLGHLASAAAVSVLVALAAAAPASALVTSVGSTTVGLQPRQEAQESPSAASFGNEEGNAVVDGASVYAVYWDPGAWLHHEWIEGLDEFFQALGASSGEPNTIFAALGQYRDRANEPASDRFVFKGAYSDTAPYPEEKCTDPASLLVGQVTCVTDAQVREQLLSFIAVHGTEKGMHAIYYLITPPGVTVCLDEASTHCSDFSLAEESSEEISEGVRDTASYKDSFCSYHGAINPDNATEGDGNTVLYATIPWSAGYEGRPNKFRPSLSMSGQAYDCQDGGYYPAEGETKHEHEKELSKEEKEHYEKANKEEKEQELEARKLEGPHVEEPNQEPELKEEGDFAAGLSDVLINQIAVEQANVVTDPLLSSWRTASGLEATDECRNRFGSYVSPSAIEGSVVANPQTEAGSLSNVVMDGHHYYINNVVNLGELHRAQCVGGISLIPRFTAPNPVNAGELVAFDGMESTVTEFKSVTFGSSGPPSTTYATFSWNFGDGTPEVKGFAPGAPVCEAPWLSPCAASAFHSYQYGGEYTVKLTITDAAGNIANITHTVTVDGPARPGSSSSTGTGTGAGAANGAGKGGASGNVSTPVASAQILSRSVRSAARKGLVVGYGVSEQVAGRFEVLLSRSQARSLGISGAPATGLPAGTPAQLVVAKAILVTTKGGHSTIDIRFSKTVAARLARAHKLTVMVRLFVKAAASANPAAATTVLSRITLPR